MELVLIPTTGEYDKYDLCPYKGFYLAMHCSSYWRIQHQTAGHFNFCQAPITFVCKEEIIHIFWETRITAVPINIIAPK